MIHDKCIGFDVETAGDRQEYALQPYRMTRGQATITAASWAYKGNVVGELKPSTGSLRRMLQKAIDNDLYVLGWNVSFDAAWCIAAGCEPEVMQVKWLDAMLLWRHWMIEPEGGNTPRKKRKSYAMQAALNEFFANDAGFKEFDDFQAEDSESLERLLARNKGDALFTVKLAEIFWSHLTPKQRTCALIEARCIPMVAKTIVMGIKSYKDVAQELSDTLKDQADDLQRELNEQSPETAGINLGSTKQLRTLLFETWGLPIQSLTDTGAPSTDKYALFDLAFLDPRAKMVKELRESKNNRTKYAEATIKSLDYNGDGYVRPGARVFGTYTSRMTYSSKDEAKVLEEKTTKKNGTQIVEVKRQLPVGVALHQWKRGREYRDLIQAPPGYTLTEFDFSGQEFRWMAVASEDQTMLGLCAPGEDAHSYMGAQVAGVDYRDLAKRASEDEAQAVNDRKAGKFCIAEGELVLTDSGLIPIEDVSLDNRVWDGIEWVRHEGLIFQGVREIITYDGLTATPDHKVYLDGFRTATLAEVKETGHRIATSERNGEAVRVMGGIVHRGKEEERYNVRNVQMPEMSDEPLGCCAEFTEGKVNAVQGVRESAEARAGRSLGCERSSDSIAPEEMQRHEAEVRKSEGSSVQELRGTRDKVPVCECERCSNVHQEDSAASGLHQCRDRSDGQRQSLCAWESSACNKVRKPTEHTKQECDNSTERSRSTKATCLSCTENNLSRSEVCPRNGAEHGVERSVNRADEGTVAQVELQTKRVYDLANAGPRHRFTVSGRLVSNCNLSYQYRVSPKTATKKAIVEFGLSVDEPFIRQTQSIYNSSYPGVEQYWSKSIRKGQLKGYAETFAGRRVQLSNDWSGQNKWPNESTAINYPIQGTGGDQKYLALAVARNHLAQFGGIFYYELHDGLFFIFPDDKVDAAIPFFRDMLSYLPYKQAWGVDLPIQFPVDSKKGKTWGQLVEVFE